MRVFPCNFISYQEFQLCVKVAIFVTYISANLQDMVTASFDLKTLGFCEDLVNIVRCNMAKWVAWWMSAVNKDDISVLLVFCRRSKCGPVR
jgi:hypothetical protein